MPFPHYPASAGRHYSRSCLAFVPTKACLLGTEMHTLAPPAQQTTAGGANYNVPIRVRIRGSSSAQQQHQKSLAIEVRKPGNTSSKGEIEFIGAWVAVEIDFMGGLGMAHVGGGLLVVVAACASTASVQHPPNTHKHASTRTCAHANAHASPLNRVLLL